MAASKITFDDKVGVTPYEVRINQVWDLDMNQMKLVVNDNADLFDSLETEVDANTLDIIDLKAEKAEKDNIVNKVADYTAVINDYILVSASVADITITLPTAIGVTGKQINITKIDSTAFNIIVDSTSSQLIIGSLTQTLSKQWSNATFVSTGSYWVVK
jgi:hypothetical protein